MKKNSKLNKAISWDDYFMGLAKLSALRSKDPSTQVGACIVNRQNHIIGMGYNGMPNGEDELFPWESNSNDEKDNKYPYVMHAEVNAILNTSVMLQNSNATIYTSLFPCSNCAKIIVQSQIKELVYEDDKYHDTKDAEISRYILETGKVKVRKHKTSVEFTLNFPKNDF